MATRGRGVIVNIGWDQAETAWPATAARCSPPIKGAVMAFTRSLAQSLAPQVRVNCVAPGWIRTAWGDDCVRRVAAARRKRVAPAPLGRARRRRPRRPLPRLARRLVHHRPGDRRQRRPRDAPTDHRLEPSECLREHIHFVTGRLAEHALRKRRRAAGRSSRASTTRSTCCRSPSPR